MICVDTTFLIDLWRHKSENGNPCMELLRRHSAEVFAVPVTSAGEFLEGCANVSSERIQDGLRFLKNFEQLPATLETALVYSRTVAWLRQSGRLPGMSRADAWIASTAIEHGARLASRNVRHFEGIPSLFVMGY